MSRYRLICVADLPDAGSFDDPDEAIVNSTAYYEPWDSETGEWLTPTCQEELDEAHARLKAKRAHLTAASAVKQARAALTHSEETT